MKQTFTLLFLAAFLTINAQIDQVSVGAAYSQQTFYDIETGEKTSLNNNSWDLAFSVLGFQDASILINEAAGLDGSELELYLAPTTNFNSDISPNDVIERLYNDEKSWFDGAFNQPKDPSNFADFGWGMYDPASMSVFGSKVYVLKMRNGNFKKIFIDLELTTYKIKYADLDGSNEKTVTFDKMEFSGNQFAYFSFNGDSVKDLEPEGWDLLFTRYNSPVPDGEGAILDYLVTGVLTKDGIRVAEIAGKNPDDVTVQDADGNYSSDHDVIGFDWKEVDINTVQWVVYDDLAYILKMPNGDLYKLVFIDFEGSSTGVSTFSLNPITPNSIEDLNAIGIDVSSVFPNPNLGDFSVKVVNNGNADEAIVRVTDQLGRRVHTQKAVLSSGTNQINITTDLPSNVYYMTIQVGEAEMVQKLIVN